MDAERKRRGPLKIILTTLLFIFETLLLVIVLLLGVMYVLAKGPSKSASDTFAMSVRETSAIGFLADIFYTPEQLAEIEARNTVVFEETDASLVVLPSPVPETVEEKGPVADAWGLIDDDGDGIIISPVHGSGYNGYMMVVLDPSRVIMGSVTESFWQRGYTLEEMCKHFNAVAGINAGGFPDANGQGNGSFPDGLTVFDGTVYAEAGPRKGFVGFDSKHILHCGAYDAEAVARDDIRYGTSFGPVLIVNGEMADESSLSSGVNPRTAIGQRSDGAVLLLVIEGRMVKSLGATYKDVAEVMLANGAVNACNLDGGSSSLMWYKGPDDEVGGYVNTCASVLGIRPIPTSFIVLPKEGD